MNKELFEQLALLRIQEREIKEKIELLVPQVNDQVVDLEAGTVIETTLGEFTVSRRRTWEYSPDYEKASEALKKLKKEEEQKGIATYTEKPTVIFKAVE